MSSEAVNFVKAEMNTILHINQLFFSAIKVQSTIIVSYHAIVFRAFCVNKKVRYGQCILAVVGLSRICTDRNQKAQKFGTVKRFDFTGVTCNWKWLGLLGSAV